MEEPPRGVSSGDSTPHTHLRPLHHWYRYPGHQRPAGFSRRDKSIAGRAASASRRAPRAGTGARRKYRHRSLFTRWCRASSPPAQTSAALFPALDRSAIALSCTKQKRGARNGLLLNETSSRLLRSSGDRDMSEVRSVARPRNHHLPERWVASRVAPSAVDI